MFEQEGCFGTGDVSHSSPAESTRSQVCITRVHFYVPEVLIREGRVRNGRSCCSPGVSGTVPGVLCSDLWKVQGGNRPSRVCDNFTCI